ncbi:MAG: sensor histidine kinase, partial [Anaerolineae bacterium]|nr:sensor histidine kinase [Anaerolineae bacterium]
KIRYRDILDFTIESDRAVLEGTTLKLILQPLVENAIYHGIKNKRGGGNIAVRACRKDGDKILFEVEDNGIGMTAYKLHNLQAKLNGSSHEIKLDDDEYGFGLENVNQRVKLYYGQEYGLSIDSEYHGGTQVRLVIPMRRP